MRRPTDIRETLYRLLTALHATTCEDRWISERRCIVYLQHYAQRHATTNGYQRDVASFTYCITRNDMRRPTDIRETLYRLLTALLATTCGDQWISERRCIVYLQHYAQRHAKTNGYQRDVVSFTYSITRNDMRRPTDIRDTLYRLFTALHATTCEDQWISERRCIVYLRHYTQRHATTNGYQRDVVSFTYSITRNDMRRTMDIRETLYRLLTALRATTCDDQRISERRCIVYLQHYTQRHAKTDGYQRDVVSFTYSITRNDMRRPTDIRETLHRLLTALHATTCGDQRISERRCIVYLQHYTQRHAKTDGYQRDVVSFTYSITRNDMRRPTDIRETLHRLLTALHATTCGDQRISERRCIVYLQHYSQRHAETSGYQRDVVSFTYSITRNDMRRPTDIREKLYRLFTALHATTCDDQRISERRCIVYLQHYTQRHAKTEGYQTDVVSFTYSITHNDMRRPTDIRETLYLLLTALRATTCDDQRISKRCCIFYLQHNTQRHAKTDGYQRDVVSFTCSITRNDMRRPTDIRETLHRLLTALHATTCEDRWISERRCIVYLQHYAQRHATTNGYQRDVASFTYCITRNDMRQPTDIRETLYRLFTALRATTCGDQWISERRCIVYLQHYSQRHATTNGYQRKVVSFTYSITRNDMRRPTDIRETLHRLLTALHATTCGDQRISERRCIVYLQHYSQRHAETSGYQRDVVSFTYSITRNDMRRPMDIRETLYRLHTALHATTCDDQRISETRCIVYLQHYTQRHAKTNGYQRDVVSFTYGITRNDMRRPTDIRETLYRLLTALHATTCEDRWISERRCIVYLQHYAQRHATTNGYQRDVASFTYCITRNDMRRPTDIRETLYRLLTALLATTCGDQWISERRCIVYLQHYTQRHATTNGYQRNVVSFIYSITRNDMRRPTDIRETLYRLLQHYTQRHAKTEGYQTDVVSFTYSITHNDMRRPTDIRETLYLLLTALRATTCDDQRISKRCCIFYLQHNTQRHAKTDGYQRDVVSFTYSITRNDMRRPTDIRETLHRLLTALHATTCEDRWISERRCIVYLQHYAQRHATTNGYQRDVASFTYCITRNDMRQPTDIRETLYRLFTALRATTCGDQWISERRCIVYLQHYSQRHATTNGYQRKVVSFIYSITRNDMRRPKDIRQTLYRLLTALHTTTCDDQRISERRCIFYLQHYAQRHATTNGYQRDVVSFTYSIKRNDMRRPMDIRETLYRLLAALRATTCEDQRISERRCIVYLQHYTQRHATTDGYQRDVVSFTYSITRNYMRRPTDIKEMLYLLLTA